MLSSIIWLKRGNFILINFFSNQCFRGSWGFHGLAVVNENFCRCMRSTRSTMTLPNAPDEIVHVISPCISLLRWHLDPGAEPLFLGSDVKNLETYLGFFFLLKEIIKLQCTSCPSKNGNTQTKSTREFTKTQEIPKLFTKGKWDNLLGCPFLHFHYISIFYTFNLSPSSLLNANKIVFFSTNTLILIIAADFSAFSSARIRRVREKKPSK